MSTHEGLAEFAFMGKPYHYHRLPGGTVTVFRGSRKACERRHLEVVR